MSQHICVSRVFSSVSSNYFDLRKDNTNLSFKHKDHGTLSQKCVAEIKFYEKCVANQKRLRTSALKYESSILQISAKAFELLISSFSFKDCFFSSSFLRKLSFPYFNNFSSSMSDICCIYFESRGFKHAVRITCLFGPFKVSSIIIC